MTDNTNKFGKGAKKLELKKGIMQNKIKNKIIKTFEFRGIDCPPEFFIVTP